MIKKDYNKPNVHIRNIHVQNIMTGSGSKEVEYTTTPGDNTKPVMSKRGHFDFDNEEEEF